MSDLKRVTIIAVILIVVLRISIGWQFLYEGLWKIDKQNSDRPWSAEGYLKSAQGPLRDTYRNMLDDPDEFNWLDYGKMSEKWTAWIDSFTTHYELNEEQKKLLAEKVDGHETYTVDVPLLPSKWRDSPSLGKVIKYDRETKKLVLDGKQHLMPKEYAALQKMAPIESTPPPERKRQNDINRRFRALLERLNKIQSRLSFREKLRATLKGDPEIAGVVNEEFDGSVDGYRPGKIDDYKKRLQRYADQLATADQAFEHDHLAFHKSKISESRAATVLVAKGLEQEMKNAAMNLLSVEQIAKGPMPSAETKIAQINKQTIWALTILGTLLILGLGTRMAAVVGAGMLLSFYMVQPPWPWLGLPDAPGPEHAFIVNKNLIEVFALLAIAALPSGSWFGLDGLLYRLWIKLTAGSSVASNVPSAAANREATVVS